MISPRTIGLIIALGIIGFVISMIVFPGCRYGPDPKWVTPSKWPASDSDLQALARFLTGSFTTNRRQHELDPDAFPEILIHVARIWRERNDGVWLYLEQAAVNSADQPDRQRVIHLAVDPAGTIEYSALELGSNPTKYIGAWRSPALLRDAAPESLVAHPGCSIQLRRYEDRSFRGATERRQCPCDFGGAAYMTTDLLVSPTIIIIWDRAFDANGNQVWGDKYGMSLQKENP